MGMAQMPLHRLARREREVAEIVFARGEASAVDVGRALSDPISNAAVRSMLTRLEAKGVLSRRKQGKRFFYAPAGTDPAVRDASLRWLALEHFGGSLARLAATALDLARAEVDALVPTPSLQAPPQIHQPTPMARMRARSARQAGAARMPSVPSGIAREPESIGPTRLSRLNNA
jgi:predicted transcriptional regulator